MDPVASTAARTTPPAPKPLVPSLLAYCQERFPIPVTAMLGLAVGGASYAAAQGKTLHAGMPLLLDGTALGGAAMIFLFLLHLRVFDEHKDYALDSETRPDRPVQRGLVTLGQLKILGGVSIAAQFALALAPGLDAAAVYAIPVAYSVLMLFEFFAKEWLEKRIVWYAVTHTTVMALLVIALGARFFLRVEGLGMSLELIGVALFLFIASLALDVLRKTWAPESEVDGLDSYSKRLGIPRAGMVGMVLVLAGSLVAGWVGWRVGGRIGWMAAVVVVTAWGLYEIRSFVRAPSKKGEKKLEMVAGVHMLVLLFGIAIAAGVARGIVLGFGSHFTTFGV